MTSSDVTALPDDAKAPGGGPGGHVARRGDLATGRPATPGGLRLRRVQRRHHRPAARPGPSTGSTARGCDLGRRRRWPGRPGPSSSRWWPAAWPAPGAVDAVVALGAVIRGDTGHYDFVAGECAAGLQRVQLDTGRAGGLRGAHHRHRRPGARALAARRAPTRAPRRRVTALETVGRAAAASSDLPSGAASASPSGGAERAAPGPAQGLAREGHPRPVRRRRPGRQPVLGRRLPGHHRRPPGRRGADPAAPGDPALRGRRAVRPRASPAGTGSRSGGATVTSLGTLQYSKATANPIRVVLAVPADSPVTSVADLAPRPPGRRRPAGVDRVPRADPPVPRASTGCEAEVSLSYGATEAKVPDIADCVVEITETGRALRAAGLRIVETLLGLAHRAHRQPGRRPPTPTSATPWSSC